MVRRFLAVRVVAQIMRQVTQPLSKTIVRHVKKHPFFREYVLVQLGRVYYWCQTAIRQQKIPPLRRKFPVNEVLAMELGTQMLLEAVIFGCLFGVLIYETVRATQMKIIAEAKQAKQVNELIARKCELMCQIENQRIVMQRLKHFIKEYSREINCPLPELPKNIEKDKDKPTT